LACNFAAKGFFDNGPCSTNTCTIFVIKSRLGMLTNSKHVNGT